MTLAPQHRALPPPPAPSQAPPKRAGAWRLWLRRIALGLLASTIGALVYDSLYPPVSTLMIGRWLSGKTVARETVTLDQVSPFLIAAVINAEDAHFCRHHGVDWGALREIFRNARDGGSLRGGSTLDMQLVKNLILPPQKLALRKAVEMPLTLTLNLFWSKRKILAAYFNVAEWGEGIFGAEAASKYYFHKPAAALSPREAALLAAALPNPRKRDPRRPDFIQARKAELLQERMARGWARLDCLSR